MARKAKDPNKLTQTQERFLAVVRKHGGLYLDRSFDVPKFVARGGGRASRDNDQEADRQGAPDPAARFPVRGRQPDLGSGVMPAEQTSFARALIGTPEIMLYAARKFESGAWIWHRAGPPYQGDDPCIFLAVVRAANELDRGQLAYDAIIALQRFLGAPVGDWNDAKGRTLADVTEALRSCAALHQHRAAA